jgi:hypothetical protein
MAADIDKFRDTSAAVRRYYGNTGDGTCGAFVVPSPVDYKPLRVLASRGAGWEHVSVSRANRCPTWGEMEHVKRLFFEPGDVCMQLHVTPAAHLNAHPYCLHIWRPTDCEIPLPPPNLVAPPA